MIAFVSVENAVLFSAAVQEALVKSKVSERMFAEARSVLVLLKQPALLLRLGPLSCWQCLVALPLGRM